jgi:hypothetical protein
MTQAVSTRSTSTIVHILYVSVWSKVQRPTARPNGARGRAAGKVSQQASRWRAKQQPGNAATAATALYKASRRERCGPTLSWPRARQRMQPAQRRTFGAPLMLPTGGQHPEVAEPAWTRTKMQRYGKVVRRGCGRQTTGVCATVYHLTTVNSLSCAVSTCLPTEEESRLRAAELALDPSCCRRFKWTYTCRCPACEPESLSGRRRQKAKVAVG